MDHGANLQLLNCVQWWKDLLRELSCKLSLVCHPGSLSTGPLDFWGLDRLLLLLLVRLLSWCRGLLGLIPLPFSLSEVS